MTARVASPTVAVVGAGWSGATCARLLGDAGVRVEVFERSSVLGGHSRTEMLDGVVYEPNGPHVFHTSDAAVATFVQRFGMHRPFEFAVLTEAFLDDDEKGVLVSWPLQVDEVRELTIWPTVERELRDLPARPIGDDLASYVTSMMGPTLYRVFVEGYTRKQWGRDPAELSSSFASHRIALRHDGNRRMFRDRWEFFPSTGANDVIQRVLEGSAVTFNATIGVTDLDALSAGFDAVIVTAALDEFANSATRLEWRGVRVESQVVPTEGLDETVTPAYVINCPSLRVPYTRTSEPKHATGQRIHATVVGQEFPGTADRHYPVATVTGQNEAVNARLATEIRRAAGIPVYFVGRLAEYAYINQDEAIRHSMDLVEQILPTLR